MSHNPSERDADSPAPGGAGNPFVRYSVWAMSALGQYVLSIGPVWWLVNHRYLSAEAFKFIYYPIWFLPRGLIDMLESYARLWAPTRP